ncbi:baseplate J/gp47 family protein [Pseudoalteromonas sp. MMG013]|uniref:baseplate assembly protein n=1 Tax=Pseudoalteromonas sp. MMG013 TaxID=2822687 RepID=UPI001B3857ED|nr:baseplate J/gp47 family protein [Pseudoalteromonas sp. MMG013]MBQ4862943.1 baseplate J/gp47 family protein [Pseudoalteromonas sp. MMG013]
MNMFNLLDMSKVPLPDSITVLDYETKYAQLKHRLLEKHPEFSDALTLESEPLAIMLEMMAYQALLFDSQLNDAVNGNMLASATGNDLDAIASRYNLSRDSDSNLVESDERFRRRIQMVFEGLNTAGSKQAYQFHALSADARVKDVYVYSPQPCVVELTILSHEGHGIPSTELVAKLRNHFGLSSDGSGPSEEASKVRPLGDKVSIFNPSVVPYNIEVSLVIAPGPSASSVEATVKAALNEYITQQTLLGRDISQMGLFSAINQPGVENGQVISPAEDVIVPANAVGQCRDITINTAVRRGDE